MHWYGKAHASQNAAGYATDRRNRLAEDWDTLAGAESLHISALPRGGLCTDVALLGTNAAGMDVVDLDAYAVEARVAALQPEIQGFKAWVMDRLQVRPPAPWAARGAPGCALTLTLVDRDRAAKRCLVDQAAVAAAARARGFAVRVIDFEPLRLAEQLAVLQATDVLLAVHGGALPLVMFLPRGAVRSSHQRLTRAHHLGTAASPGSHCRCGRDHDRHHARATPLFTALRELAYYCAQLHLCRLKDWRMRACCYLGKDEGAPALLHGPDDASFCWN